MAGFRTATIEQLIDAHELKIGDTIAGVGDDGQFLGTIQRFELIKKKNGGCLYVVTETGTYKAILVCYCPSELEIETLCKQAREKHFQWKREQPWNEHVFLRKRRRQERILS